MQGLIYQGAWSAVSSIKIILRLDGWLTNDGPPSPVVLYMNENGWIATNILSPPLGHVYCWAQDINSAHNDFMQLVSL